MKTLWQAWRAGRLDETLLLVVILVRGLMLCFDGWRLSPVVQALDIALLSLYVVPKAIRVFFARPSEDTER